MKRGGRHGPDHVNRRRIGNDSVRGFTAGWHGVSGRHGNSQTFIPDMETRPDDCRQSFKHSRLPREHRYRRLSRRVRPAPWIAEHWR